MKNFLKKRPVQIIGGIAAIAIIYTVFFNKDNGPEYVLAEAVKGDLIQTVSVTGSIQADPSLDLHFQKSGKIDGIFVEEGDSVQEGELLASLENEALELEMLRMAANVDYARAQYEKTRAGAKYEEILIADADLLSAEAAYSAALVELENTKQVGEKSVDSAEAALEAAQNDLDNTNALAEKEISNLGLNSGSSSSIALNNAYTKTRTQIDALITEMQDSLFIVEDIIGVKGSGYFLLGSTVKNNLKNDYHKPTQENYNIALEKVSALTADSPSEDVDEAIALTLKAANDILLLLSQTGFQLEKLPYTRSDLSALIVSISTQSTALSTATLALQELQNTILTLKTGSTEDIDTLTLSYQIKIDAAESALISAENTLDQTKLNAEISNKNVEALVALKKAAVDTARSTLALKKAPARGVDLAPLAAQITQAEIAYKIAANEFKDSQLFAPIDAVVSFVYGEVGENISITETSLSPFITLHADNLIVEANVPETDIVKIEKGDHVEMTIDAFDFTEKFHGDVIYINPAETVIQGVIYYKIKTAFDVEDTRIKSGMTVNLEVETDKKEDILTIPLRAIKFEDSKRYVEVLNNGKPIKTYIGTGIESDQFVEVTSGLNEGDKVITFVK